MDADNTTSKTALANPTFSSFTSHLINLVDLKIGRANKRPREPATSSSTYTPYPQRVVDGVTGGFDSTWRSLMHLFQTQRPVPAEDESQNKRARTMASLEQQPTPVAILPGMLSLQAVTPMDTDVTTHQDAQPVAFFGHDEASQLHADVDIVLQPLEDATRQDVRAVSLRVAQDNAASPHFSENIDFLEEPSPHEDLRPGSPAVAQDHVAKAYTPVSPECIDFGPISPVASNLSTLDDRIQSSTFNHPTPHIVAGQYDLVHPTSVSPIADIVCNVTLSTSAASPCAAQLVEHPDTNVVDNAPSNATTDGSPSPRCATPPSNAQPLVIGPLDHDRDHDDLAMLRSASTACSIPPAHAAPSLSIAVPTDIAHGVVFEFATVVHEVDAAVDPPPLHQVHCQATVPVPDDGIVAIPRQNIPHELVELQLESLPIATTSASDVPACAQFDAQFDTFDVSNASSNGAGLQDNHDEINSNAASSTELAAQSPLAMPSETALRFAVAASNEANFNVIPTPLGSAVVSRPSSFDSASTSADELVAEQDCLIAELYANDTKIPAPSPCEDERLNNAHAQSSNPSTSVPTPVDTPHDPAYVARSPSPPESPPTTPTYRLFEREHTPALSLVNAGNESDTSDAPDIHTPSPSPPPPASLSVRTLKERLEVPAECVQATLRDRISDPPPFLPEFSAPCAPGPLKRTLADRIAGCPPPLPNHKRMRRGARR